MSDNVTGHVFARTGAEAVSFDEGLRRYMLRVYNLMVSGVLLTGIIALYVGNNEQMLAAIFGTPLKWVVMFAPLAFVMVLSFGINRLSSTAAGALFWAFAGTMGLSLSSIFAVYTDASIARVFFITAATFAAMSLYGYTTKTDLSKFGSFLIMGLIGIVIAGLVNIFVQSSMMQFVISVVGVLVFTGLTAWDTQRIRQEFYGLSGNEVAHKSAMMGALSLYLNFINLFMMLLNLLGQREE